MKILITNYSLLYLGGTELYTISLAKELNKLGHEIYIFSLSLGEASDLLKDNQDIKISDNLDSFKNIKFDILHLQHNIMIWLVRAYFPDVPAIMNVHGILPELEQPPKANLDIKSYIVVSNGVKEHLIKKHAIKDEEIIVINNWVDRAKFFQIKEIKERPENMLILSNHMLKEHEKIYKSVCKEKRIKFVHVGLPENPVLNVEKYINDADVVVTVGRGAIEAMSCRRNVIVCDLNGIDGMVTPENYKELLKNNFSGHRYKIPVSRDSFLKQLSLYSRKNAQQLEEIILTNHVPEVCVPQIVSVYERIIKKSVTVDKNIVEITNLEMKYLSRSNSTKEMHIKYLNNEVRDIEEKCEKLTKELESIKISKSWGFISFCRKIVNVIKKIKI